MSRYVVEEVDEGLVLPITGFACERVESGEPSFWDASSKTYALRFDKESGEWKCREKGDDE